MVFLEQSITIIDGIKLKLLPWPEFKRIIFDIIEHRIEHAPEINGVVNTNYMSLDEHLIIFFTNNILIQKIGAKFMEGTRPEIEQSILEFIYNLKYYSTRWLRAKTFAEMVGFLHVELNMKHINNRANSRNTTPGSNSTNTKPPA